MYIIVVLAAATWYIKSDPSSILFNPTNTKRIHGLLQLGALGSLITGIYAIYQATLIPEPQPALTSIHSWVGTAAIALYMVNFLLAIVREVVKYCSDMAKPNVFLTTSIHVHRFLGLLALLSTSSAIVTGIMDFNGSNCDYVVTDPDNNPAQHYGIIPTGCQISNGTLISYHY